MRCKSNITRVYDICINHKTGEAALTSNHKTEVAIIEGGCIYRTLCIALHFICN